MASNLGSIIMRLVLIVPLIGLWLMVHPEQSYACSCAPPGSPSEALEGADAVFMGRAVSVKEVEEVYGDRTYVDSLVTEFKVATVWKGPFNQTIYINSGAYGASCGLAFTEGAEYIVYAYHSGRRGGLGTGLCTRTTGLSGAMEDLAGLGQGTAPVQVPSASTPQATHTPIPRPTGAPTPQATHTPIPQPTATPAPQATDSPVPPPSPTPDMTETGGGCSLSPNTVDLSAVGLLAGLAWFGLRKRRSGST